MAERAGTGSVLLVDDNVDFQQMMAEVASRHDCRLTAVGSLREGRHIAGRQEFDLLLVDLGLPDGDGLDLIEDVDLAAHGQLAIITGSPSFETAVRAVGAPVAEYLVKPVPIATLTRLMGAAHDRALARSVPSGLRGMIGRSEPMWRVFDQVRKVAPLDACVFLDGESGTGKELVANAIHDLSGRSGRFVAINCGAIPGDLMGSQLFGHEKGAFTGAVQSHAGCFEQAEGGTLFLDEITEMPAALQVYLLRVLETRSLTRVGGANEVAVDVRVIAACNRDPRQAMDEGRLRPDLYYRLAEFPIGVPALRERREDIPLLAQHFLDRLNRRYGTTRRFDTAALQRLAQRNWPGNVRELRHAVQRYYILCDSEAISVGPEVAPRAIEETDGSIRFSVGMTLEDVEREMLLKTLASCNNNKRQAARALGITAKTVYNRLLRYRSQGHIGDELIGAAPDKSGID